MLTYDERTEVCIWEQENDDYWHVVMFSIENVDSFFDEDGPIQENLQCTST